MIHSGGKSADSAVAGEKPNPRVPSSVGSMDEGNQPQTFETQLSGAVDVFPIVKAVGTITQEITPRTGETSTPTEVSVSVSVPAEDNETEETRLTERLVIAVKRLDYLAVCGLLNEASMHGLRLDLGGLAEHGGSSLIQLAVEALRELDPHSDPHKAPNQMQSTNPTIPCGAIVMELSQHMSFNQLNNENRRRECVVHQLLGLGHVRMAHHILEMKRVRQDRERGHAHVWQQASTAGVVVEIFGKDIDRPDYTKYHSIGAIRQAWIMPEMPWAFARGEDFKVDPNFQPIPLHHGSMWFREFTGRTQRVTVSPTTGPIQTIKATAASPTTAAQETTDVVKAAGILKTAETAGPIETIKATAASPTTAAQETTDVVKAAGILKTAETTGPIKAIKAIQTTKAPAKAQIRVGGPFRGLAGGIIAGGLIVGGLIMAAGRRSRR